MVTYCVFLIIILADSDDLIFFLCIRTHNQERKIIALLHTIGLLFHLRPKSIWWWFLDYEFDLFVLLCCQIFFFHYLRRMMMYENEWKTIRNNKKIDKDKKNNPKEISEELHIREVISRKDTPRWHFLWSPNSINGMKWIRRYYKFMTQGSSNLLTFSIG